MNASLYKNALETNALGVYEEFVRVCEDGFHFGWHEANGGNLSCYLGAEVSEALRTEAAGTADGARKADVSTAHPTWVDLPVAVPALGGAAFMVTRTGCHFRSIATHPENAIGTIRLNSAGSAYTVLQGFEDGGSPTSELAAHLLIHAQAIVSDDEQPAQGFNPQLASIVYHAHPPYTIALSHVLDPDSETWASVLRNALTEVEFLVPGGVGILPRMEPGSVELARATVETMRQHPVCIWSHHGATAHADSFDGAFGLIHTIEKAAQIALLSR